MHAVRGCWSPCIDHSAFLATNCGSQALTLSVMISRLPMALSRSACSRCCCSARSAAHAFSRATCAVTPTGGKLELRLGIGAL